MTIPTRPFFNTNATVWNISYNMVMARKPSTLFEDVGNWSTIGFDSFGAMQVDELDRLNESRRTLGEDCDNNSIGMDSLASSDCSSCSEPRPSYLPRFESQTFEDVDFSATDFSQSVALFEASMASITFNPLPKTNKKKDTTRKVHFAKTPDGKVAVETVFFPKIPDLRQRDIWYQNEDFELMVRDALVKLRESQPTEEGMEYLKNFQELQKSCATFASFRSITCAKVKLLAFFRFRGYEQVLFTAAKEEADRIRTRVLKFARLRASSETMNDDEKATAIARYCSSLTVPHQRFAWLYGVADSLVLSIK